MSLGGKRHKHSTPASGVASGLSSSKACDEKKLRGEGDGQIPHATPKKSVKKPQGNFEVC